MTTQTDTITLRSPTTEEELKAFYEPLAIAFGEDLSPEELEAERPLMDLDRLINAFDGERRVGSAGAFSMQLTVPGGAAVGTAGITAVGVVPDQRRRGVLRQMMRWLLDDATRRGEPIAILWASEAAIYQRFGFGMSTLVSSFEVDRARIVFREPLPPRDDVRIRMVEVDEAAQSFSAIYERIRASVPGSIRRAEVMWRNLLLPDALWMRGKHGARYRAVIEIGGEVRGYTTYRLNNDWDARGPNGTLLVLEVQALDPEAEDYLWQWLVSMDLVVTFKAFRAPVPHPLQLRLLEPRRLGVRTGDGLWLRFVDVARALEARTYAGAGEVVLEVQDPLIESNAGRWRLRTASDGTARVTAIGDPGSGDAAADIGLSVGDLASVYLGAWRFSDLVAAGRVRELRPGAVWDADRMFATPRPPYANTMF